jgi:hyperosmotically inducible periplasmic protein
MARRIFALLLVLIIAAGGFYIYKYGFQVPSLFSSSEDESTTRRVKASFAMSKRLTGYSFDVATSGGVVTLTGQSPSEGLKSLAGEIARDTKGVKEVNNQIGVDPNVQPASENAHVADLEIRAAILESFAKSPELGGKQIDVKVESRTVTLSGSVDTQTQRNGAEQAARAVDGVAAIANELQVTNPQAVSEPTPPTTQQKDAVTDLAKQVEFELYRTGAFDTLTMKVVAAGDTVTLSGTVRSAAEKLLAEKIVQSMHGVAKVVNELSVVAPPPRINETKPKVSPSRQPSEPKPKTSPSKQ